MNVRNGQSISWRHHEDLYKGDTETEYGLRHVPKLKFEHIYLSSFSKMRVDLAAQVHYRTCYTCILKQCAM